MAGEGSQVVVLGNLGVRFANLAGGLDDEADLPLDIEVFVQRSTRGLPLLA